MLDTLFTISGFLVTPKLNVFDGTRCKQWCAKMILWLMAMNIYITSHMKARERLKRSNQITYFGAPSLASVLSEIKMWRGGLYPNLYMSS